MRIVHVLPSLIMGGAERAVIGLANWQAGQGNSVTLAVGWKDPNDLLRGAVDPTVGVEYIGNSQGKRYLQGLLWVGKRQRWLTDHDVVHVHLIYGAVLGTALYLLRAASLRCRPVIIETYHAVAMPIPAWQQWLHTQLAKLRDAIVLMADDPYWRQFRKTQRRPRTALIPNGLSPPLCLAKDDPVVREYRAQLHLPDDSLVIAHVGRLVHERRPELILQVFGRVAREAGERVYFLFVGGGPEEGRLKTLARELGIDKRIRFPGLAPDPSIAYAAMDVFLTINAGTVTGLAGVHAALCGVPIVAVQLDPEYQPAKEDWIWSSSDLEAVAVEAARLLREPLTRARVARRQTNYAHEHLTVDRMGEAYALIYDQLVPNLLEPSAGP